MFEQSFVHRLEFKKKTSLLYIILKGNFCPKKEENMRIISSAIGNSNFLSRIQMGGTV